MAVRGVRLANGHKRGSSRIELERFPDRPHFLRRWKRSVHPEGTTQRFTKRMDSIDGFRACVCQYYFEEWGSRMLHPNRDPWGRTAESSAPPASADASKWEQRLDGGSLGLEQHGVSANMASYRQQIKRSSRVCGAVAPRCGLYGGRGRRGEDRTHKVSDFMPAPEFV